MMPEDIQSLRHLMPFVMTSDDIPQYDILYVGQQQEDELHCYVFDVAPKKFEPKKLYFQGRIWVDDQDFQIVKTSGKTVPETHKKSDENLFPKFTTWREQVDGQYWFPAYTLADDTLHFRKAAISGCSHPRSRQVHRLQALRIQGEGDLRGQGTTQGQDPGPQQSARGSRLQGSAEAAVKSLTAPALELTAMRLR